MLNYVKEHIIYPQKIALILVSVQETSSVFLLGVFLLQVVQYIKVYSLSYLQGGVDSFMWVDLASLIASYPSHTLEC